MLPSFSLKRLAELTGSVPVGDLSHEITGVDSLESAGTEDLSFLANLSYKHVLTASRAGIVCVDHSVTPIEGKNFLVSDNPSFTFQRITKILRSHTDSSTGFEGIHPTAVIHPTASIEEDVTVGPYTVIDKGATVGRGSVLYAHVTVGTGAMIGEECTIYPHATIRERCILRERVTLQPGAVIGACGYGYITDPKTKVHTKIEQVGIVVLEAEVEVGANTTIDRARFKHTLVGRGTKIDNLVQIGHNVELGKNNLIVSQTGIAGSTKLGNNVVLGGQCGIAGHISIADDVVLVARGGVDKSLTLPGIYKGSPASPRSECNRRQVMLRKIGLYVDKIRKLEERIERLLS
ncbi:MAG: UDP-3-O-(3-hydroxymyristoyl)glucosamine N-acyltransferase [Simkaniaceae bacterium]|nr:UDP-3-O-(3-hydroxymyristoyl)glucosamine N-acyltransferase [Simkaniaceae bacterium]